MDRLCRVVALLSGYESPELRVILEKLGDVRRVEQSLEKLDFFMKSHFLQIRGHDRSIKPTCEVLRTSP